MGAHVGAEGGGTVRALKTANEPKSVRATKASPVAGYAPAIGIGEDTGRLILAVTVPIKVVSVNNLREHWAAKAKRTKTHRLSTCFILMMGAKVRGIKAPLPPLMIRMTRIAPRRIKDSHDNLRGGFKAAVDGVADWLGIDDGDPRVTWEYAQKSGGYAALVEVFEVRT